MYCMYVHVHNYTVCMYMYMYVHTYTVCMYMYIHVLTFFEYIFCKAKQSVLNKAANIPERSN